ncbi:NAD(P)H-dependent FMN reductase [bioreactor metagenome]|uniref:NAD(P)H-dependent FMN reductase n=1 Tax=bioreactor metagenome TaxID=1076179 RepID=A0A644YDJ6_9ZZZZ|nr:NAD(P)H-dependent oxidoreductase [Erysipelotrichaceae bacterium]
MENKIKILAFAGSLREHSYNKLLLQGVKAVLPEDFTMEIFDLSVIPMYNQDDEDHMPDTVLEFKEKIEASDIILIASPEYNFSISGALKNALDWASRPYNQNSFDDKPVGIMGASFGMMGTSRAQYQLRQIGVALNMRIINRPEIMLGMASSKFSESGELTDIKTKELILSMLTGLRAMIK